MTSATTHRGPRAFGGVLAMAVLGGTVLLGATSASAVTTSHASDVPKLSIAIDNGQASAKVGERLDYEIVVDNLGAEPVTDLVVTQTMPEGLDFATADVGGALAAGVVTWHVRVPVDGHATVHASAQVSVTPADTLRLASVACATTKAGRPPIVCASHSDQLPAGAVARAAGPTPAHSVQGSGSGRAPWALGAGLVLVLGGWAVRGLVRRGRKTALTART